MKLGTLTAFYDQLHERYCAAAKLVAECEHKNVHRGYQHTISSQVEDLFAVLLSNILSQELKADELSFFVDNSIKPNGTLPIMRPDIAIVKGNLDKTLVSYLDLKTDLGFKREYFHKYEDIKAAICRVRESEYITMQGGNRMLVSPAIKWRTVVFSEDNCGRFLLENKNKALLYADYFELYFLASGDHPNYKRRNDVHVLEDEFDRLLNGIRRDVRQAGRTK